MPTRSANRVLVLGGIRSGKSGLAESLVRDAQVGPGTTVRYVATATSGGDDPSWTARIVAHRERRPADWQTVEVGADPGSLVTLLTEASPDDVILVDDLASWLTATFDGTDWADPAAADTTIAALAEAIAACPAAQLVMVSPEVGLSLVPQTPAGRTFADAHGILNQRVAAACDAVALVVAGQPTWLVGAPPAAADRQPVVKAPAPVVTTTGPPETIVTPAPVPAGGAATVADADSPEPSGPGQRGADPIISVSDEDLVERSPHPASDLPMPDDDAAERAVERLGTLRFDGTGLGGLTAVIRFAAGAQGRVDPRPWQQIRTVLLRGDHAGGCAAGDPPAAAEDRLDRIRAGVGALSLLAGAAGAGIVAVRCPDAAAIEEQDALSEAAVDAAIEHGRRLADEAVDSGVDLLVLASCGSGTDAAAVAVTALLTGGEPAALLARVVGPDGTVDDAAWMARCATIRDALHRVQTRPRDPRAALLTLGGGDLAVAAGLLLGATARRTPVLIDGPVGLAAALVARDFSAETRHWLLLPDTGNHPMIRLVADVLTLQPVVDLRLGLGEGATALATLPLLRTALTLAGSVTAVAAPDGTAAADGNPADGGTDHDDREPVPAGA